MCPDDLADRILIQSNLDRGEQSSETETLLDAQWRWPLRLRFVAFGLLVGQINWGNAS